MTTLTEAEKINSISKGKPKRFEKKKPKPVKVQLCNPFDEYWPLLKEKDADEVGKVIRSTLVKLNKPKIPWKEFQKYPKDVRKEKIKNIQKESSSKDFAEQRECIKFGVNEILRGIRNLKLASCILAADTDQIFLMKKLVLAASMKRIPVLVLPKLKELSNTVLGFHCITIGIKREKLSNYVRYQQLHDIIVKISKKYPYPLNGVYLVNELNMKNMPKESKQPKKKCKLNDDTDIEKTIYLYRKSKNERVFKPPLLNPQSNVFELGLDIIPFTDGDDDFHKTKEDEAESLDSEVVDIDVKYLPKILQNVPCIKY